MFCIQPVSWTVGSGWWIRSSPDTARSADSCDRDVTGHKAFQSALIADREYVYASMHVPTLSLMDQGGLF